MAEKILFVDDDAHILSSFKRTLRKHCAMDTALGPEEGLRAVQGRGPYALVISDLRMPVMDGIQFLTKVRTISPDTVRMILTGNADLQAAMDAVNQGNIFRFLTKPCPPETLLQAIQAGVHQHRLIRAEKELLEKTLRGAIQVMADVLSLVNPEAFGRASRVRRYARAMGRNLGVDKLWQLETAALLSQIGCVILTEETIQKIIKAQPLTAEEQQLYSMYPSVGADLISKIPRLQEVSEIIAYQEKHFDGSGIPKDDRYGDSIPLGARILKVVLDFDTLESAGLPRASAILQMKKRHGWYDPQVLRALENVLGDEARFEVREIEIPDLKLGMIVGEDVVSLKDVLLIKKGQEITPALLERLKNFAKTVGVKEPIRVLIPVR
ncbi:Response regulator c-di-GMP phosphodiesterase, RpfG family, contains REC and HD-GYP domains [Desulfacinum hydrothermale DSM 13146]|uniref:Response regulator c-di-GMP phosphodiesterase, RpfG family, contains REC and HD-GYP domains n=1 Tax=Desulfacinum hydrothermale DSM 13146 TaxID=1121390 RepID=A0A1W1XJZ7_9BACT|nr:HD domain-containing phosphohydrolase [Desulfacinum hydrothermale]SMC24255.1 Response regulator c-di-GMP phosphodiesterase, RpfG family, contains REC and HD-GYP domains [Desulfacinum hydrothermale DSM 13146]